MPTSKREKSPPLSYELKSDRFLFRPATPEDAEALILITEQAQAARRGEVIPDGIQAQPERIKRNKDQLSQPTTWAQVALAQGETIGFVLGYPVKEERKAEFAPATQHLAFLMVSPSRWGEGVGGSLLDWVIAELSKQGVEAVNLWTEVNNERSRPLYERKGFRVTGKERLHPETQEHQVEYILEL